jgi:hypothetical protein
MKGILCKKHRKKIVFMSKYSLERNNTIFFMFLTQYTPDFFVAEHYMVCETIPHGGLRISPQAGQTESVALDILLLPMLIKRILIGQNNSASHFSTH